MRLLVINNLKSGYQDGAIFDFLRLVANEGDEIVLRCGSDDKAFENLLEDALNFDAVVASGGDGTIAAISYGLANTGIPLLPFPAGTANLLALNLSSPMEPHALAKQLKDARTLDFDLGELILSDKRTGFIMIAGAGYDATIMRGALPTKHLLGPMAYLQAAITHPAPQKSHFTLTIDGTVVETEGLGILVANFSKIQFDIPLVHNSMPRDGVLDVIVLKGENALELLPGMWASILDRDGKFPDRMGAFEVYSAKEITVEANPPLEVQFDGEVANMNTPFSARCLKGAVRLIVSEECMKSFGE